MNAKLKILIAYDGSTCADAALNDLELAGLPREAEAVALAVTEVWLQPPPSSFELVEAPFAGVTAVTEMARASEAHEIEAARAMALQAARLIESKFPGWTVRDESHAGSPASTILKTATAMQADLIVVGSHGRSAMGRLILGSVSHKTVTEAPCSVRVARGRERALDAPIKILVGVDGSHCAQEAVRALAARDWPAGSEARVIAVYDEVMPTAIGQFIPPVVSFAAETNNEERAWIREIVEASARELRREGLEVSTNVLPGDPRRAIVAEAEAWGADCIFVGARGLSKLDRFLLGSVSAAVATRAHCSVEVVRTRCADASHTNGE